MGLSLPSVSLKMLPFIQLLRSLEISSQKPPLSLADFPFLKKLSLRRIASSVTLRNLPQLRVLSLKAQRLLLQEGIGEREVYLESDEVQLNSLRHVLELDKTALQPNRL